MSEHSYGIKLMFLVWQALCLLDFCISKEAYWGSVWLHAWFICIDASLLCILMPEINTRQTYSHVRVRSLDDEAQKTQSVLYFKTMEVYHINMYNTEEKHKTLKFCTITFEFIDCPDTASV